MNLVRAELERLAARRFVQLMVVLLIVAFGITVATTLAGSHRPTTAEVAQAQQQAAEQRRDMQRRYQDCLMVRQGSLPDRESAGYPVDCAEIDPAARQNRPPSTADYLYGVFVFEKQIRPLLYFLIAFLTLFGFLVGASYIGVELASGGMTNLLLWRPQRMTVLGTKLGTLLGAVLAVSVLSSVPYVGAFWVIARVGGLTGDLDPAFWSGLWMTYTRGLVLVLAASATGFAVAALGRHTAAALGAVAGYLVVWELGARIVLEIVDAARPDQWMLSSYLAAWLVGEAVFWDNQACRAVSSGFCDSSYTIGWPAGLAVLVVLVGVCVAGAFTAFRRRDLA